MPREKLSLPEQLDLTEFISKEAHDLKSPFNRILGFTKMILKGMDGPLTDMQKDDLTIVYENSNQAMAAMSNLVDMARLSRGEKTFTPTESNLTTLLAQVANAWKQKAVKDVEFNLTVPEAELKIQADEALLRQCLLNWLLFANEHSQAPSSLSLSLETQGHEARLTIESRGKKNIAAAEMHLTMTAYIAQSILKLHSGQLLLAEGDDEGTLVQIALPLL